MLLCQYCQQIQQMSEIKKQQNKLYGEDDEQYETQKQAHNESLTEKNDRKKKRKKKIKRHRHPPQYYEELRREKQNRKREEEWNDRFNLGSIPNMFEMETQNGKKKQRLKSLKRFDSTKQKEVVYKTFDVQNPNQTKSKPSKSFNIRIMAKKQEKQEAKKQASETKKTQGQKQIDGEEEKRKQKQKQEKQSQKQKQTNQLIEEVNKVYQELKFADCHRDLLIDIIKNSNNKGLKSFIHAEIAKLKGKTSFCSLLQASIQKRENIIKTLQESKENMTLENIKKYRLITLRVIEEVLQWKQECENSYHELTKIKPKLTFTSNGQNYLLEISKNFKLSHSPQSFEGNTFLLGYEQNTVDKDLLVKIRACQMLLLENELETESQ